MNNAAKEENNNDTSTISISSTYHDLSQLVSQDITIMVAIKAGLTTYDLGNLPFFHPSIGEGIRYTSLH
jgi:pyruvate/2-oxoglutarate dehydrogenase complex dihydrolipoamide dehydrogenase (E3) component